MLLIQVQNIVISIITSPIIVNRMEREKNQSGYIHTSYLLIRVVVQNRRMIAAKFYSFLYDIFEGTHANLLVRKVYVFLNISLHHTVISPVAGLRIVTK